VEAELARCDAGHRALADEVGHLLFAVVNLARKVGVQPGPALDRANAKFRRRFEAVEELATARGIAMQDAGLAVLDGMWDEAKLRETRREKREEDA
jgi:uncharacterized protein YabN with tetrapyrrole methylase and pyrophosphatase domain